MTVSVLAIVQARMSSTRLPGKVLKKLDREPLIKILFQRLSRSKMIDKIILATSASEENDVLEDYVKSLGYEVYRGSEDDVLDRFYGAAQKHQPETIVRITGDCPIIDPQLVDDIIDLYQENKIDYVSNTDPPTYPDGLDTETHSSRACPFALCGACV